MSKPIDPNKDVALAMFDYNFITGQLSRKGSNEEFPWIVQHNYKLVKCEGRYVGCHRVAWLIMTGDWPVEVDHVNRIRSCNTWINLRDVSRKQNTENRPVHKNNKLGIRGIRYRPKDGFYQPRLMHNGKAIYLGIFKTLEDAIAARKQAEQELFTHAS